MLLLLFIVLVCAAGGRLVAQRLLPDADVADRAVAWTLLALTQFLCVPVLVGLTLHTVSLSSIASTQAAVLLVITGFVALAMQRSEEDASLRATLGPAILRGWFGEVRMAGWPTRLLWGLVIFWIMASTVPGWFLEPRIADAVEYHTLQPVQWLGTETFELGLRQPWDQATGWWWGETYPSIKSLAIVQWVEARGSFRGAGMIQGLYAGVWMLALWALGRRLVLPGWAVAAAGLAVVSMPDVILQSTEVYADLQAAAAVALVLWALAGLRTEGGSVRVWIWFAGLALGHLAGTKASVLVAAGLLGVAALVLAWRRGEDRPARIHNAAAMLLTGLLFGLLFAGIWLLRNVVVYNNPLYPIRIEVAGRVLFPGVVDPGVNLAGIAEQEVSKWFFWLRSPFESIGVTHLGNRLAGTGPAAVGLLLPATLALALRLMRERTAGWTMLLAAEVLLFIGLPDLWWPRYTLCLMTVGGLAFALLLAEARPLARGVLLALLVLAVGWNTARAIPSVTGWPRPPLYAAYPFLTGDARPEALWRTPDAYSARDFVREELASNPANWIGYVTYQYSPYWIYEPGGPYQIVALPGAELGPHEMQWVDRVLESRATHVVAHYGWAESLLMERRPEHFRCVFRAEHWAGEHPWSPGEFDPMAVWEVVR
ncbi:MAG: hypothetical protein PWP23_1361 [Candidatus Sumerlaeota bacterium]|nr:hypothetical protein [Candidatus Sumerlaeota bacterium]